MVDKAIVQVVKHFIHELRAEQIPFEKIILFGSQINDRKHRWSDIDVAVVSSVLGKDRQRERVALAKIACRIDPRIEPHPIGLHEFENNSWESFIFNVKRNGIEIAA